MYFVVDGHLHFLHGKCPAFLHPGDWACEASLWTDWLHCGELSAQTECTIVLLDAVQFQDTASCHPLEKVLAHDYAKCFVDALNHVFHEDTELLTDLDDKRVDVHTFAGKINPVSGSLSRTVPRATNSLLDNIWENLHLHHSPSASGRSFMRTLCSS